MVDQAEKILKDGKKSIETLLREKAYSEVKKALKDKDIDIESVSDEDIENLVAAKAKDMQSILKGFSIGAFTTISIPLILGL